MLGLTLQLLNEGALVSILTVSVTLVALPALSLTEHSMRWVPSPETLAVQVPAVPDENSHDRKVGEYPPVLDGGERPVLTWPDVVSACVHRLRYPTPQDRPRSSLLRR